MFTMMNEARLAVGLQGVAVAERATQRALAYANERKQGRAPGMDPRRRCPSSPISTSARMLITMRALPAPRAPSAMRPPSPRPQPIARQTLPRATGEERAALLTPVAKAFSTDIGSEVASLGIQVHGGMGFIEETGAAQLYRDARIAPIYEGTNGIQAIDLVTRKVPMSGGTVVRAYLAELREMIDAVRAANDPAFGATAPRLAAAADALERATSWLLATLATNPDAALAGATSYLRLFGATAGGCMLTAEALAASRHADGAADKPGRIAIARFFAENIAVQAPALAEIVTEGADAALNGTAGIGRP